MSKHLCNSRGLPQDGVSRGVGWFANRETCVVDTVVQETLYWNLKLVYPHSFTSVAKTNFFSSFSAGPRKACSTLTGIRQLRNCSIARKRRNGRKYGPLGVVCDCCRSQRPAIFQTVS
jgi:hypothetical protein